ncbi:MAG: glycoside hydrolase family 172 protein [Pseudomonadota bacterium]
MSTFIDLARLKSYRSKKLSSYDKTGGNRDFVEIPKGTVLKIPKIKGPAIITHIWMTLACEDLLYPRKVIIRAYWDDETEPSIEAPIGDFFGVGHGKVSTFISAPLAMIATDPPLYNRAAFNCFFPMPFAKLARFEILNECDRDIWAFFYHISYEEYPEGIDQTMGRFHAQWRRVNPCKGWGDFSVADPYVAFRTKEVDEPVWNTPNLDGKKNYLILDAENEGHYVGCNLSVDNITNKSYTWFGEGDEMIFIDGEHFPPSIHGTGTEDYFCCAFGLPGKFSTPYFGISLAGDPRNLSGKWTLYRYHIESPINFKKSIRVTIEHGHANNRYDDLASVAYWYQKEPHKPFSPILSALERLPRIELVHPIVDFENKDNPITE